MTLLAETRPTVLVIDDDDDGRLLTVLILEERGFSVWEADGGQQAIDLVNSAHPDIVLLDAMMPGLDGFETCRKIRALAGAEHLPILMLTGLDDDSSISRAYESGATDFFVKSEHWTLLAQRIEILLQARKMRDELALSRAKEARAERIAHVGYWEWDVTNATFVASEECVRLVGRPALLSSRAISVCDVAEIFQFVHVDDRARIEQIVAHTLACGGNAQFECQLVQLDNGTRTVHLEIEVEQIANKSISRVYGVIQDITERKRAEEQVKRLANYDSLTGLPNRHFFNEQLTLAIENARREHKAVALLIIDLDRFKQINDTLGHAVGDQLLREVGLRLTKLMHDRGLTTIQHDVLARLSGDEFAIVLGGLVNISEAETVAQLILVTLRKPIPLAGHDCITSGSIGIANYPQDGDDAASLMRCADTAKNAAKANGKNALQVYRAGISAITKDRMILEQALHKALERDELVMFYQPQIDTRLGKIVGAEALMRWRRDGKLVQPADFISIAEDTGLIFPFGEWAINDVLAQDRAWIDEGFAPLPMAVNIPGGHFERPNFVNLIKDVLARQQILPEYLELEITETSLMRNLESTLPILDAITDMGISLSVDDFGTGYSSLSYLRRLPIDTLKIDASFVRELVSGSDNEAIVAAIIAMAKSLNLRIIAEGVETLEQMTLLNSYGCHLMQGYYFSRPIPAEDFARFRRQYDSQELALSVKKPMRRKTRAIARSVASTSH